MRRIVVLVILGGVLLAAVAAFEPGLRPVERSTVWSIGFCDVDDPLALDECVADLEPALTADMVTDVDADFVADPFLVSDSTGQTVFFEILNGDTGQGDIGVATSPDGEEWTYRGLALDEEFHLSYPRVFRHRGSWYMTPESEQADRVALYRADTFPMEWERVATLVEGEDLADPTVFRHDGRWWMFVGAAADHDRLRLFHASDPEGPWKEHAKSPLIVDDAGVSRPAGGVVQRDGGLFRLAQDSEERYGRGVVGFEITELTPTEYSERPLEGALLGPGPREWNSLGMHHLDAVPLDGRWLVAVDGYEQPLTFRVPRPPGL